MHCWIYLGLVLFGLMLEVAAAQVTRYYRIAMRDDAKLFVGRFAISEKDAPNLDECYRFVYDAQGKLLSIAYLERGKLSDNFNAIGAAEVQFRYNARQQLSEKQTFSASRTRTSTVKYLYNKRHQLIEEQIFGSNGLLRSKITLKYDDSGRLVERAERDAKNNLQNNSADFALQRFTYTETGHLHTHTYYDASLKVLRRNEFVYENGRRIQHAVYGSDGKLIEKQTFKYDDNGRVIETADYDEYDQLKHTRRYKYDSQGNLLEQRFFNAQNVLAEDSYGVAITELTYNAAGTRIREVRYDALARPIIDERYNDFGRPIERRVINEKGQTTTIIRTDYDRLGNRIKETTLAVDERNREVLKEERFFEKGSLVRQRLYDKNGKLIREVNR